MRSINPLADVAAVRECAALVHRIRPDLIHAHSSKAGIVGRLAGRITRTPTVFTAHGWGFSPGVPRQRQILALQVERVLALLAQKIICVSEFDRQLALCHHVGTQNSLRTVRGGIGSDSGSGSNEQSLGLIAAADLKSVPKSSEVGHTTPHFIMVARFSEQKDQANLLRALAQVNDVFFDFVGSGPLLSSCKELAALLGLETRVAFLGDRHDVAQLLHRADAFVLSTHYEGLPISILEAMRAGLPVIASDVGGNSEEIEPGKTGLLVPKGDVAALAEALRKLARSQRLRKEWGACGREKFLREFTAERMLCGVETVYREIWDT